MNTKSLIAKIESDVAAHARFDKQLVGLTIAALSIGLVVGIFLSVTSPFAIFSMAPQTVAVSIGLVILACFVTSNILAFQTSVSARYGYGALFLLGLGLCKWAVYQFAPHGLLNDVISFDSVGHNVSCFFLGFAASAVIILISICTHWKLRMAPAHRARITAGIVSASAGLIAQTLYCPYLNLSHLFMSHIGQVFGTCTIIWFLDRYLMRIWFVKFAPFTTPQKTQVS